MAEADMECIKPSDALKSITGTRQQARMMGIQSKKSGAFIRTQLEFRKRAIKPGIRAKCAQGNFREYSLGI